MNGPKDLAIDTNDASRDGPRRTTSYVGHERQGEAFARVTDGMEAFAVCHYGSRSEAGAGTCFIKFGAVRDTPSAEKDYLRLLDACGALAVAVGMRSVLAGVNMARHEAYVHLVDRGFRTEIQGVAMHRKNDAGYCRPGLYIIDDWR